MPRLTLYKPIQVACIVYACLVGLGATEVFYFWGVLVTLPWSVLLSFEAPWGVLLAGLANLAIILALSVERAS